MNNDDQRGKRMAMQEDPSSAHEIFSISDPVSP